MNNENIGRIRTGDTVERVAYLDNAATQIPLEEAVAAMNNAVRIYGNPSSSHGAGRAAAQLLKRSRNAIVEILGCDSDEFYFTPSGTFSNNAVILGVADKQKRHSKRIITTNSEHSSIERPLMRLEGEGYEIIRLTTKNGGLDYDLLEKSLREPVSLVTIMYVNNEIGTVYDISKIRKIIDRSNSGALLHCDNVQGFLKEENPLKYCDFMSISSHKIGGIKGCGGLYIKRKGSLLPIIEGGGQEGQINPGTEALPAIAAFAAAAIKRASEKNTYEHILFLREYLLQRCDELDKIIVIQPMNFSASIVGLIIEGVKSEIATNYLSSVGVYVSAGSACSSRRRDNRVLNALGLKENEIESVIRVSFSPETTREDIDLLIDSLKVVIDRYSR